MREKKQQIKKKFCAEILKKSLLRFLWNFADEDVSIILSGVVDPKK